jgi:hypothetical protein
MYVSKHISRKTFIALAIATAVFGSAAGASDR